MNHKTTHRQIFVHGSEGQRVLREVLGAQLVGLMMNPQPLWLVSPWVSNFAVLDNRSGNWSFVEPAWGNREIYFQELLAGMVNYGVELKMVTRDLPLNRDFVKQLYNRLHSKAVFHHTCSHDLHTKGMLSPHFFIQGSMNFTWRGANRNEESVVLTCDQHIITEARTEFEKQYFFAKPQETIK